MCVSPSITQQRLAPGQHRGLRLRALGACFCPGVTSASPLPQVVPDPDPPPEGEHRHGAAGAAPGSEECRHPGKAARSLCALLVCSAHTSQFPWPLVCCGATGLCPLWGFSWWFCPWGDPGVLWFLLPGCQALSAPQTPSCSSASGRQSAACPLCSPTAGSSEPAGDGHRGRALHEHPGEMRPSLLLQVRSGSCGSPSPPTSPCHISEASQHQVPVVKPQPGTSWGFFTTDFPVCATVCHGSQQMGLK